jgi:hypothetical protein
VLDRLEVRVGHAAQRCIALGQRTEATKQDLIGLVCRPYVAWVRRLQGRPPAPGAGRHSRRGTPSLACADAGERLDADLAVAPLGGLTTTGGFAFIGGTPNRYFRPFDAKAGELM